MIEKRNQSNMILEDNLWKVMFKLSIPAIIGMLLHGLNIVFDAIFVGNFVGEIALSGVSLAYPLTQIAIGFGSMIGGGAGAYLSIAIGKKEERIQNRILGNVNFVGIVSTMALMIILLLTARPLLIFMGGTGEVLEIGLSYFKITIWGVLFWVFALSYNMVIRAEGKMGLAASIMGTGLVINIIANYIFMGVLKFGVEGAAWGTNIGMAAYTLFSVIYFKSSKPSFKANIFSIHKDKEIIKNIISMGMPSLIMSIMSIIQGVVILNAIGVVGNDYDIAFYGVSFRIYMFMMTPLFALMRSLQPTVGINIGAKNFNRVISATKVYIIGSIIVLLPLWLFAMVNPHMILGLMLTGNISDANIFNFRIFVSVIPLLSITMNGMSYFPSINKGKIASVVAMLRQVILYIPSMILLPRLFGLEFVYIGSFLIDVIVTIIVAVLLIKSFSNLRNEAILLSDKTSVT